MSLFVVVLVLAFLIDGKTCTKDGITTYSQYGWNMGATDGSISSCCVHICVFSRLVSGEADLRDRSSIVGNGALWSVLREGAVYSNAGICSGSIDDTVS